MPLHVQSYTQCENNVGTVSWAQSDGAEYYTAIAVADDGHTHMCNTNETVCMWDDLHCGEHYTVQVVANDYMCSSSPSNSTSIRMGTITVTQMRTGLLTWRCIFLFCDLGLIFLPTKNILKSHFLTGNGNIVPLHTKVMH